MAFAEDGSKQQPATSPSGLFVRMRCPNCGLAVQGAPDRFQDTLKCPNCEQDVIFLRMTEGTSPKRNPFANLTGLLQKDKIRVHRGFNPMENILAQKKGTLLVRVKCPQCGAIVRSPLGKINEPRHCPKCKNESVFRRVRETAKSPLPFAEENGVLHRLEAYSIPWSYVAASFLVGVMITAVVLYFNPPEKAGLQSSHPQAKKLAQLMKNDNLAERREGLYSYLDKLPRTDEVSALRLKALESLDEINQLLLTETTGQQQEDSEKSDTLLSENQQLKTALRNELEARGILKEKYDRLEAVGKLTAEELVKEKQKAEELSVKLTDLSNRAMLDQEELLALKKQFQEFRDSREKPLPVDADVLRELSAKISPAILTLRVKTLDGELRRGRGGKVVVHGRELLLTDANLVRYATEIMASDIKGKEYAVTAAALVDEARGIAFLALPESADTGRGLALGKEPPTLTDIVVAPGAVKGSSYLAMHSYISQLRRLQTGWIQNQLAVQTELALSPDAEGGPLFNLAGEVIGVNVPLDGQEQAQNFIVDIAGVKESEFFNAPVPLSEIEATKVEAARRERLEAEAHRRSENIQMYYKKGYKMSDAGLMFQVPAITKGEGDNIFNLDLQTVNPDLSDITGGDLYLVGFDAYTRAKVWVKVATASFMGEGWGQEELLLEGFKVEEESFRRMTWNIIRGWDKLELFIGTE
ncbi:MAG: trypsin-like peptidase domain-containing protein [Planctomycetes bacterium]|nr:trypsin-like peptidase domain-containing protein [Planctomycetota bacterium]